MKKKDKKRFAFGLAVLSTITILAFANVGNVADNESLRTQIRYNADNAGVVITGTWTHVQSDRKMVVFGGTLSSTQQLHTLFCTLTNFNNFITQVQQDITTPDGNPYPQFFSIGFDPYKKEKKTLKTKNNTSAQHQAIKQRSQKSETKPKNVKIINFLN
ncbi:MAG: hypothetical protein DRI44_10105 [Chlamydiae bacterium]|nr:MAG: hypothetical protein DRI44_10105 [Chlamydiota bacterium]